MIYLNNNLKFHFHLGLHVVALQTHTQIILKDSNTNHK